jgi:biotin carboxyl carrier protein
VFIILRAKSAVKVSPGEYLGALRFWRANYPNDSSVDLVSIDAFFLQEKYDMALAAVERLDTSVGGDPYLDSYRAGLHLKMGQKDLANTEKQRFLAYTRDLGAKRQTQQAQGRALFSPEQPAGLVPPSVRQAARAAAAQNASAKPTAMRLQGVFMRAANPTAIISGKNVAVGDSVEDGSKVVKIEASRVTLQNPQGDLVSLTYQ